MEEAPTPNFTQNLNYNKNKFDFEIKKEIKSDKNNKFFVLFQIIDSKLSVKATSNDMIQKIYSNSFSVNEIKENKYFLQFDDLQEICEELQNRISEKKISLMEDTNIVIISIPLPSFKIKDIVFELKEIIKSDKELIKELTVLVQTQKNEISILNKKVDELSEFKKEMSYILNYYISNLDSIIINDINYNSMLKNWINPNKRIKANLLYRLSRDGPEISTFHSLCDNKGSTLTLFYLTNQNIVGFFAKESFDSNSGWKKDPCCFLFNLNQKKIYKKLNSPSFNYMNCSLFCGNNCGPSANCFGCNFNTSLKYIYHSLQNGCYINKVFENGSMVLESEEGKETEYEVIEAEILQIIIY